MNQNTYETKRIFFDNGNTKSYEFRIEQLKKLKVTIYNNEDSLMNAFNLDLGKPQFEAYTSEIGIIYEQINSTIKNLKKWMKPTRVNTPLYLQPGSSHIYPEPKGVILIISPWNYPFQLAISPLIGAIAAGNCAIIKPSNKSINTQNIISKIISEAFDFDYISVVEGPGNTTVNPLIKQNRFDHIFFTGSVEVGKKILELSAKHITTVTLELGGKSPAIVHKDADIAIAAKRITWAKFFNVGQTCIAPDYVLVHESKKEALIEKVILYIKSFYGEDIENSNDYGRIISENRFDKLLSLLDGTNILVGSNHNKEKKFIAPTLVDGITMESPIMKEEIFGPLLPIMTYRDISEVVQIVKKNRYPLSLYLFTEDKSIEKFIIDNIEFGGGCINHALSHVVNPNLPFGGVGYSGMGAYHSKYSFDTFSHMKSIFKPKGKFEATLKYPPYNIYNMKLVKKFLK